MAVVLQVFFQHCFCGAYSQCMCPSSGDTIICLCTYSQTPLPMTKLDRNGNPWLKAKATRDQPRGQLSIAQPYAMLHSLVSFANQGAGFEALLAEQYANPCTTPSHLPSPVQGSACLWAAHYSSRRHAHQHVAHPCSDDGQVLHSAPHILSDCPLVSIFCDRLLKDYSLHYLFWTVKGAEVLATFLVRSNSLLRPLPACPDPL